MLSTFLPVEVQILQYLMNVLKGLWLDRFLVSLKMQLSLLYIFVPFVVIVSGFQEK